MKKARRKSADEDPTKTALDSERVSKEGEDSGKDDSDFMKRYIAAVKAAGEYNSNLEPERIHHQSWLAKDRRIAQGAGSKGEDEDSSHSE